MRCVPIAPAPVRRLAVVLLVVAGTLLTASAATARAPYREPALTVDTVRLDAALHCPVPVTTGGPAPILLVTGTHTTGATAYALGRAALLTLNRPLCYVDFPHRTTGDLQISVQYLVRGIRTVAALAGRRISMFGISQGGLLPRWALTYWPSLRGRVSDVLAAAGTQHGSAILGPCSLTQPCIPAEWQQMAGSHLITAVDRQADESPGPTAWTTVRSSGDEVVQPQGGPHPASALRGATNILIQDVCPGRTVDHIGTALDSVTFAAFKDALARRGPARVAALPRTVCASRYAPGVGGAAARRLAAAAVAPPVPDPQVDADKVPREPALAAYARRRVPAR